MKKKGKTLWLITARSGSKSIKDKNIKELNGIPLLAYRIKSALSISSKSNVWVSTDSKHYSDIAKQYKATVPFLRPQELAKDNSSSMDVVMHAIEWAELNDRKYDAIGLLEPTSPFIYFKDLKNAEEELFNNNSAENIVAVRKVRPHSFFIQKEDKFLTELSKRFKKSKKFRRQDRKNEITPSGGFYIAKWDAFKRNKTFYTEKTLSYLVPEICGLEIDESIDWQWADFLLSNKLIKTRDIFK